jgi:hypothetical protein
MLESSGLLIFRGALEERAGLRTSVSRYSHSSEGAEGGTGAAAGIAERQVHQYYLRWVEAVKRLFPQSRASLADDQS